jgi:ABC-type phosphate transport system substrate-binding protein
MTEFFNMQRRHALRSVLLFACFSGQVANTYGDEVVIVVNKDNANSIDLAYVAKIYSGAVRSWPDGTPVIALDQPEDTEVRTQFSAKVLNRSVANMKAIWSQNVFSGKGLPPKVIGLDVDVKRAISSNKNAIGYMLASQVDPSVKVLVR